jgi:NAD+ kinase
MRLRCTVSRGGEVIYESHKILNEIVLSKGSHSAMPEIEVYCNDEEVGKYFSDGLICATPTGSTAYSLSAGGPILDPSCGSFCISHICPQSFYAKSMVFGQKNVLTFRKGKRGHGDLFLTADGQLITEIKDGDESGVVVRRLSTANKTDSWHDKNGYVGNHKRFQLFEYSHDRLISVHYV